MPDFTTGSDAVNVEQIMEQIRARIREKRGVEPTEPQVFDLAATKLGAVLDPRAGSADLVRALRARTGQPDGASGVSDATASQPRRTPSRIRLFFRRILKRLLKPVAKILSEFNEAEARAREAVDATNDKLFSYLAVELTRTGIELNKLRMEIESLSGRLEFNERRARALESTLIYKPAGDDELRGSQSSQGSQGSQGSLGSQGSRSSQGSQASSGWQGPRGSRHSQGSQSSQGARSFEGSRPAPSASPEVPPSATPSSAPEQTGDGQGLRSRRRRRRRGRRGGGAPAGAPGAAPGISSTPTQGMESAPNPPDDLDSGAPGNGPEGDSSDDSEPGDL